MSFFEFWGFPARVFVFSGAGGGRSIWWAWDGGGALEEFYGGLGILLGGKRDVDFGCFALGSVIVFFFFF